MVFSCLRGALSKRPLSFLLAFDLEDFLSVFLFLFSLEFDEESIGVLGGLIEDVELSIATEKIVEKHAKHVQKVQFQKKFWDPMQDFSIDSVVEVAQNFFTFVNHHSSFGIHHSSFIIHHSSFIIIHHHSSFIIHHHSLIIKSTKI